MLTMPKASLKPIFYFDFHFKNRGVYGGILFIFLFDAKTSFNYCIIVEPVIHMNIKSLR